jgi:hypothetical protein
MEQEQLCVKADEDLKAAEEFFEPANLTMCDQLASILGRPMPPNCGHRTKRTPTLDELDRR